MLLLITIMLDWFHFDMYLEHVTKRGDLPPGSYAQARMIVSRYLKTAAKHDALANSYEDYVQLVWMAYWTKKDKFSGAPEDEARWSARVMLNALRDQFRKASRTLLLCDDTDIQTLGRDHNIEATVLVSQLAAELPEELNTFLTYYRAGENYTASYAAQAMSKSTWRRRVINARKALRTAA